MLTSPGSRCLTPPDPPPPPLERQQTLVQIVILRLLQTLRIQNVQNLLRVALVRVKVRANRQSAVSAASSISGAPDGIARSGAEKSGVNLSSSIRTTNTSTHSYTADASYYGGPGVGA